MGIRTAAGIRTTAGIPLPGGGGGTRMHLLPMASSPDGLISARDAVITKTPRPGGAHHNGKDEGGGGGSRVGRV